MIKTISFYDMDGTLLDTPMPESGKEIWLQKTGKNYPHIGWWSKPESLEPKIFDIKPFDSVLNQFKDDLSKSDTYTVMLTSRMEKLRPQIEKILDINNIVFDELSLKKGNDGDKDNRVKTYLNKFPDLETINIYDDRDKEIKVFRRFIENFGDKYQINLYRVSNGNISLVDSGTPLEEIIKTEIINLNEKTK